MTIRFLADECLNENIVRGLLRKSGIDIVSVNGIEMLSQPDTKILEWCAEHHRVLVSHDVNTMSHFAIERIRRGLFVPGLVLIPSSLSLAHTIEEIQFLAECAEPSDLENQILYLPLR